MRSIEFRDKPLLQADAFHGVVGRKGAGKSTWMAGTASRVTRGELGEKTGVVWIGSEDSAEIDIKPRVVAAKGDPSRVLVVERGWIQLPGDVPEIEHAMEDSARSGCCSSTRSGITSAARTRTRRQTSETPSAG